MVLISAISIVSLYAQAYENGKNNIYGIKLDNHLYLRHEVLGGTVVEGDYIRWTIFSYMGNKLSSDSIKFNNFSCFAPQFRFNVMRIGNVEFSISSEINIITKDLFGYFKDLEISDTKFRPWADNIAQLYYYPTNYLSFGIEAGYRLDLAPNSSFFGPKYGGGYFGLSANFGIYEYDDRTAMKRKSNKVVKGKIYAEPEEISDKELLNYLTYNSEGKYASEVQLQIYENYYEKTIKQRKKQAYKDFLETVPQDFDKYSAIENLYVESLWQEAIDGKTLENFINFNTQYPHSKYQSDVDFYIDYYGCDTTDVDQLTAFQEKYPVNIFAGTVSIKIDSLNTENFIAALTNNDIDYIKSNLSDFPDLDKRLNNKAVPVFYANSKEAYELLFEHGADRNYLNSSGQNCLLSHLDNSNLFLFLIDAGVDPGIIDTKYGMSVLHWAAYERNATIVEYLIDRKDVDINLKTNSGETAIELAKSKEIIALLLEDEDILISNNAYNSLMGRMNYLEDNLQVQKLIKKMGYSILDVLTQDQSFSNEEFNKKYKINPEEYDIQLIKGATETSGGSVYAVDGWFAIGNLRFFGRWERCDSNNDICFKSKTIIYK